MKKLLLGAVALAIGVMSVQAQVTPVADPAVYTPLENGYALKNLWIKSATTENNPTATEFGADSYTRGMAVKDGKLLFCHRTVYPEGSNPAYKSSIRIYDGKTGLLEKVVDLATNVFRRTDDTEVSLPCNDIQVDAAGNVLVCNLATSIQTTGNFQVWNIDLETGNGTKVLDCLVTVEDEKMAVRVDAFGVYGDITTGKAYLMAALSGDVDGAGNHVLRWDYVDGVLQADDFGETTNWVRIQKYYPNSALQFNGTAPRVCPIDEDLFYLDGFNAFPMMYNKSGTVVESFASATDVQPVKTGNNGVDEFSINGKNFVIFIYDNNETTPGHTWNLCELGPGMSFNGMTKYYNFPAGGMGKLSNQFRTALPRIEVDEAGKIATIYLFACNNGYAAYKFGLKEDLDNSPIDIVTKDGLVITTTSVGFTLSELADVEVYSPSGQKVVAQSQTNKVDLPKGLFIIKAVTPQGNVTTAKVVVR